MNFFFMKKFIGILIAMLILKDSRIISVQSDAPAIHCPAGDVFIYACPSTLLHGRDLVCIPTTWLCDQDPDCPEGEDEGIGVNEPCHHLSGKIYGKTFAHCQM